jgi:hypothetical protein
MLTNFEQLGFANEVLKMRQEVVTTLIVARMFSIELSLLFNMFPYH